MFFAIISEILWTLWGVIWKKSLSFSPPAFFNWLIWYTWWIIISIIIFAFLWVEMFSWDFFFLIFSALWTISACFDNFISQWIYKTEKISSLIPYEQLSKVFVLIFSFFFLWESDNTVQLFLAIFIIIFLFFMSFDFKNYSFPKKLPIVLFSQFLAFVQIVSVWYAVKNVSFLSHYVFYSVLWSFIFLAWMLFFKNIELPKIKKLPIKYYKTRFSWVLLTRSSLVITVFLYSNLWIIMTSLLWFLWLASRMIFSYIFFDDKPSLKNSFMAIFVLIIVSFWFYFK